MKVTAWNNGSKNISGVGYGFRLSASDRDKFFERKWGSEELLCDGKLLAVVNIDKDSFWIGNCSELIKLELGVWLLSKGYAPWPNGKLPTFNLLPLGGNQFDLNIK